MRRVPVILLYLLILVYTLEKRAWVSASRKKYDGITSDTAIFKHFIGKWSRYGSGEFCRSKGMFLAQITDPSAKIYLNQYLQSLPDDVGMLWFGLKYFVTAGWGCSMTKHKGCWRFEGTKKGIWASGLEWSSYPNYEHQIYNEYEFCAFVDKKFSPGLKAANCVQHRNTLCMVFPPAPTMMYVDDPHKCRDTFKVLWKTEGLGEDFIHRIAFIDLDTKELQPPIVFMTALPNVASSNTEHFKGLKPFTNYRIELTPCLTLCCCHHINKTIPKYFYKGEPLPVPSAAIRYVSASKECEVTWSFPKGQPVGDIGGFKITDICVRPTGYSQGDEDEDFVRKNIYHTNAVMKFMFKATPICKHVAYVQTKYCRLTSEKVKAEGSCKADAKAFDFVPSPGLIYTPNGNLKLRISLPQELYGAASCLFLVMRAYKMKPTSTTFSAYPLNRLKLISKNKPGGDAEYISLAMRRSSISRRFLDVEVSSTDASSCNLRNDGMPKNSIKAQQASIDERLYYSVYVVVTIPSSKSAVLMRSASTLISASMQQEKKEEQEDEEEVVSIRMSGRTRGSILPIEENEDTEDGCTHISTIFVIVFGVLFFLECAEIVYLNRSRRRN